MKVLSILFAVALILLLSGDADARILKGRLFNGRIVEKVRSVTRSGHGGRLGHCASCSAPQAAPQAASTKTLAVPKKTE